jgi:hypothetical protein
MRGSSAPARALTPVDTTAAALVIRLRACASFQEKLHQLRRKTFRKRAPAAFAVAPFPVFDISRIRGKF